MARWLVLLLGASVACSNKSDPDQGSAASGSAPPAATPDVLRGSISVDGEAATLTACRPGHAVHTYVDVATSKGTLRFEDGRLYWQQDSSAVSRGEELACDKLDRSWGGGFRTDGTAYWRGTLAFACRGPATIAGDLTLDCGHITAEERSQLDGNRARALDERRGSGSGSGPR